MIAGTVGFARQAARDWVASCAAHRGEFRGAYLIGSTVDLPDAAALPPLSDLDVAVVLTKPVEAIKPGKLLYRGVLLEISIFPEAWYRSARTVLSSYHLAAGLRRDSIFADPTGALGTLQRQVARRFPQEQEVRRRTRDALDKVDRYLAETEAGPSWPDRVLAWLFGTGVTTHVILVAALRNPTVRWRYSAARQVLDEYGHLAVYHELLDLLGCGTLPARAARRHLDRLAAAFDAATAAAQTRFPFSSDITALARPLAIDGSRRLIDAGDHREAMFWITVTFARCLKVLTADASRPAHLQHTAASDQHTAAFGALLDDLGLRGDDDLPARRERVTAFRPRLVSTAELILRANPEVVPLEGG